MALERYQVTIEPYVYGEKGDKVYSVSVTIDGEIVQSMTTAVGTSSFMSEIEILNRMTTDIIQKLKEKYEDTSSR